MTNSLFVYSCRDYNATGAKYANLTNLNIARFITAGELQLRAQYLCQTAVGGGDRLYESGKKLSKKFVLSI